MKCPVCGSEGSAYAEIGSIRIELCSVCDLKFKVPYAGDPRNRCGDCSNRCVERMSEKWLMDSRLALEKSRFSRIAACSGRGLGDLNVAELGVGSGALGSLLSMACKEYRGCEPCEIFHKIMSDNFPELKDKVLNSLMPAPEMRGCFDLIVAVDVLEFAPYPARYLREVGALLKKGGMFYAEVPNEGWMRQRMLVRKLLGLYSCEPIHPGHVNFFSMNAVRFLVRNAGFLLNDAFGITMAGDENRMALTLKRRLPWYWRVACGAINISRADVFLNQGNMVFSATKV